MPTRTALCALLCVASFTALAQPAPALKWITNSSVKLEQIIGDVDWASGSNTTSQTISRFNIEGASDLASGWTTFTDALSSASGTFYFTNTQTGGLPPARFYRLRTPP